MLDPYIDASKGDIANNVAGKAPPFHPHITAPYLLSLLEERGYAVGGLQTFVVVRDPREMLWSYHKYFKPDTKSRYNFSPIWDCSEQMDFERWICEGKLGSNPEWLKLAPKWINTDDLSCLSLEAHVENMSGDIVVNRIFQLELINQLVEWLREAFAMEVKVINSNSSDVRGLPNIGKEAMEKICRMFPLEAQMYGL